HSLGGTTRQIGLAWFLSAVSETALFALVPRLLRGGREVRLISVATLLYVLRYVAMALLADPRWVLLLQLTQGFTFVFFYAASIQYLYSLIPAEWRATGQTILAVLFFGISGIAGSVVGGWLFDLVGGQTLYLAMACMSGLGFLFSLRPSTRQPNATRIG
ncbi:MAG TPA: MFS transporter, partial [Candidatus Sulfotelmatobacter sp.]|nr:MFS transporter [Candidatus Sulfotelmatobacter sp.]